MIAQVEELFQELLPRPGRPSRGLAQEPGWIEIIGVLEAAFEANGTTADAGRLNALDRKLVAARRSACRLAVAGAISLPELRLLLSVVERQRQCLDIERRRLRLDSRTPQDLDGDRRSTSYLSSKMLAWTVPYALSLARQGRIQKEVLEIVLAGFRVGLQDEKGHSRGSAAHRTQGTEAAIEELSRL